MDFLTLARERFSVLEYEYRDVEAEKLEKILAAALAAPTACNLQPQRIMVIDTEEKRQKLNDAVPGGYFAPAAFLVCYDSRACWVRPQDGKAYVLTPCTLRVADGKAMATIVWSSSKYDYMLVDGVKYEVLSTENGSTFEIPVAAFDTELTVIGDTTAMSTPHEIEYTLNFDSASLTAAE